MKKNKIKEFVVYRISHIDTGKSYIGITIDYKQRIRNHFKANGECPYLHYAIRKHGKENFIHNIIYECNSRKELCQKEIEFIKSYNTKSPNGYNLTDGGDGMLNPSEETRNKLSIAGKKRILSKNHKKRISEANKGQKHSLETRKKLSEIQRGLSILDVLKIKRLLSHKANQYEIANEFKISQSIISNIKNNKIYLDPKYKFFNTNYIKKITLKNFTITKTISVDQVIKVREMLIDGISLKIIADKLKIAQGTISRIKLNKFYKKIQTPNINLSFLPKGKRKFTNNQIIEIKKFLDHGISQYEIANKFQVSQRTINCISIGKTYVDIQLPKEA